MRRVLLLAVAASALGLAPEIAQAQSRETGGRSQPVDVTAPRLLVSGLRSAQYRLGVRAARIVRDHLEKRLPPERWWVIAQRDIEITFGYGYPGDTTAAEIDVRHLSQQIRADAIVEVAARDSAGMIVLEASLLCPRWAAAARPIARAEAANLPSASGRLAERIAADSLLVPMPGSSVQGACRLTTR